MRGEWSRLLGGAWVLAGAAGAIDINMDDDQSIRDAAGTIAFGLMRYYTGNNTGDVPGNLPDPYFWWEAGAMFGAMVDYWHMTGDETYVEVTSQALLHQVGEDWDYMPENQTRTEGNDDQGFWAMAAMTAAETRFPDPPEDGPQWLALVQAVFNQYVSRWHTELCGGGLIWQIFPFNAGFDYKNSISNGCFFNVAARLARYTGNQTYADWASTVYDWVEQVGLFAEDGGVMDGVGIRGGEACPQSQVDPNEWTYNVGIFMHASAVMWNVTEDEVWQRRTESLFAVVKSRFSKEDGVIFEQRCEDFQLCNIDQRSFKGYLMRWLASVSQLAPFLTDEARAIIRANGQAAAAACTGSNGQAPPEGINPAPDPNYFLGREGTACGYMWSLGGQFDGWLGVGEQMNAMSAVMYNLVGGAAAPVTEATGGTSRGDPAAGTGEKDELGALPDITTMDRAGAGILTTVMVGSVVGGCYFVLTS